MKFLESNSNKKFIDSKINPNMTFLESKSNHNKPYFQTFQKMMKTHLLDWDFHDILVCDFNDFALNYNHIKLVIRES